MIDIERYQATYPHFRLGSWANCGYCGEIPNSRDHVIPLTFLSAKSRKENPSVYEIGPLMPACGNCNGILGSKWFDSFQLRCEHVSYVLEWKSMGASGKWNKGQINEMKGSLKEYVKGKQFEKKLLYKRSLWYHSHAYAQNLEGLIYEALLQPGHPKFNQGYYDFFQSTLQRINRSIDIREKRKGKKENDNRVGQAEACNANGNDQCQTQEA